MHIPKNPRFRLKQYDKTDYLRCAPEFFALPIIYHILERLSRTLRKCDKIWQNAKKHDREFDLRTRETSTSVTQLKCY